MIKQHFERINLRILYRAKKIISETRKNIDEVFSPISNGFQDIVNSIYFKLERTNTQLYNEIGKL